MFMLLSTWAKNYISEKRKEPDQCSNEKYVKKTNSIGINYYNWTFILTSHQNCWKIICWAVRPWSTIIVIDRRFSPTIWGDNPVSYTHLDVYKRQSLGCLCYYMLCIFRTLLLRPCNGLYCTHVGLSLIHI